MKNVLITCKVLECEVNKCKNDLGSDIETIVMPETLHNIPDNLRNEVQKKIDEINYADNILLSYGCCGNGILGITATNCKVILPRTQDCIHTLLYYNEKIEEFRKDSFFFSNGWIWDTNSELDRMVEKYGEETARRIYKSMYKHYKNIMYMNSGVEGEEKAKEFAKNRADYLELNYKETDANLKILYDLIAFENIDHRFIVLNKGEKVTQGMFM